MPSSADATINALRSGHDQLVQQVADLGPEALTRPSGCADWDLSQVLSHLGSGAEIGLGVLERALDPSTPQVPNEEIWDRWNAMSPSERLTGFLSADQRLVEAYEALDPQTRADLRIDLGYLPEPVDVATAAGSRLNEVALHSWDIRSSFDPTVTIADEATPLLFDQLNSLLQWIGHADAVDGEVTVLVETTDPVRRFGLAITDGVSIVEAPDQPAAILTLPAEAWLRLLSGRLAPERTPDSVAVGAGPVSLEDLRRVFPGY